MRCAGFGTKPRGRRTWRVAALGQKRTCRRLQGRRPGRWRLPAISGRPRPTISLNWGEDCRFLRVANPRVRNATPTPTTALLPPKTAGPTSIGRAAATHSAPFTFLDFMTLLNLPIVVFSLDGRLAVDNRSAALGRMRTRLGWTSRRSQLAAPGVLEPATPSFMNSCQLLAASVSWIGFSI